MWRVASSPRSLLSPSLNPISPQGEAWKGRLWRQSSGDLDMWRVFLPTEPWPAKCIVPGVHPFGRPHAPLHMQEPGLCRMFCCRQVKLAVGKIWHILPKSYLGFAMIRNKQWEVHGFSCVCSGLYILLTLWFLPALLHYRILVSHSHTVLHSRGLTLCNRSLLLLEICFPCSLRFPRFCPGHPSLTLHMPDGELQIARTLPLGPSCLLSYLEGP